MTISLRNIRDIKNSEDKHLFTRAWGENKSFIVK